MKKITIAVALLIVACAQTPTGAVIDDSVEIGVITALTGKAAEYGENVHQGVLLAVEQTNALGGINGRTLSVITEDGQCIPQKGVITAKKLTDIDKVVAVVGPLCSAVSVASAPIFQEHGVVMIAPVASAAELTSVGDYIFRVSIPTAQHGEALADFAADELNGTKVAILHINQENGIGFRDGFVRAFKEQGGQVTGIESYEPETTDFKTSLTKLSRDAEILLLAGQLNLGLILKQSKELGLPWTVVGIPAMETNEVLSTRDAAEGVFYSYAAFDPDAEELAEYQQAYEAKYNEKSDWFAANAYDATMLIAEGLRRCGEDSVCIKEYLYTVKDYPGVGGITTFDEYGEVDKPLLIKTVKNGEFVVY